MTLFNELLIIACKHVYVFGGVELDLLLCGLNLLLVILPVKVLDIMPGTMLPASLLHVVNLTQNIIGYKTG